MRRALVIGAVLAAAAIVAVFGSGAGGGGSYLVRAEFRNASFVVPGEEVRISGVKVGTVKSLDVTPRQTAAVVLDITRPGFGDFRADATCTIRPQSLIGENYVDCTPTRPRRAGERPAAPLPLIRSGDGAGQHRLGLANTMRTVSLDLVTDTLRLPVRQRLSLILNELGAGVAGRGEDLRSIIRDSDPALRETDRVLTILGGENRTLGRVARDTDAILAPLAAERARAAGAVTHGAQLQTAIAERRAALEGTLQRLPAFLRQLRPTMQQLGSLADDMTPVVSDLGAVAPDVNRAVAQLGPFTHAGTQSLVALGDASRDGRTALVKGRKITADVRRLASGLRPFAANAGALLGSLRDTGGVERLMDYFFYQVASANGFDSFGHYLRASLVVNLCATYATTPNPSCSAHFSAPEPEPAQASTAALLDYLVGSGKP